MLLMKAEYSLRIFILIVDVESFFSTVFSWFIYFLLFDI